LKSCVRRFLYGFEKIIGHLAGKGLIMRAGTIADATLVARAPSTKNRDSEVHSKKGNMWFFGMNARIGVYAKCD
jgi:IS5 family transposase